MSEKNELSGGMGTASAKTMASAAACTHIDDACESSGHRLQPECDSAAAPRDIACDVVIMALGTSPNPLLAATTSGLETDRRGCLTADAEGRTTRAGVFAGGDAVTGAATVILAMGAGRRAARAIDEYIRTRS